MNNGGVDLVPLRWLFINQKRMNMKYELVALLDCSNEDLADQLQLESGLNSVDDYANWLISVAGREPEIMEEMEIYDYIVDESEDYVLTYEDYGFGEYVSLYRKIEKDEKTADELAYERYRRGEYTYEEYRDVCTNEDVEPLEF